MIQASFPEVFLTSVLLSEELIQEKRRKALIIVVSMERMNKWCHMAQPTQKPQKHWAPKQHCLMAHGLPWRTLGLVIARINHVMMGNPAWGPVRLPLPKKALRNIWFHLSVRNRWYYTKHILWAVSILYALSGACLLGPACVTVYLGD